MTSSPLVSVVIPCWNQASYLRLALASVAAQRYQPVESIVIDDGSTDETSQVAAEAGATVLVRQHNQGLARARNAGLARARGEYVVFLDADDELVDDAVASGVSILGACPQVAAVVRRCELIDADGRPLPTPKVAIDPSDLYAALLMQNFVWTPGAAVFRREAVTAIGGFSDEDAPAAADYAVYLRLARSGAIAFDDRVAVRYRQHATNMSRDPVLMLRDTLRVLYRERRYISSRHAAAFGRGQQAWRAFYGEQIVHDLRAELRGQRRISRMLRLAVVLAREWPQGFLFHLRKKAERVARAIPPGELEPSRFHTSGRPRDAGC